MSPRGKHQLNRFAKSPEVFCFDCVRPLDRLDGQQRMAPPPTFAGACPRLCSGAPSAPGVVWSLALCGEEGRGRTEGLPAPECQVRISAHGEVGGELLCNPPGEDRAPWTMARIHRQVSATEVHAQVVRPQPLLYSAPPRPGPAACLALFALFAWI